MATVGKPFPGADHEWLTAIMQAEFLLVHSMAFLGFIAPWKPVDAKAAKVRAIAFWAMFAFYVALSLSTGWKQVMIFVSLTFVTYLGLFLNWHSPSAMVQLGARWAVDMVLFLLAVGLCGAPKDVDHWKLDPAVLRAGATYFFALAAVELSGLYLRTIPRNAQLILKALRKGGPRHS